MENYDKDNGNMKEIIKDLQKRLKDMIEVYDLLKENRVLLQEKNKELVEKLAFKDHCLQFEEKRRKEAIKSYSEFVVECYHETHCN